MVPLWQCANGLTQGLVKSWNNDHPERQVRPGDRIIEVRGDQKLSGPKTSTNGVVAIGLVSIKVMAPPMIQICKSGGVMVDLMRILPSLYI